MIREFVAEAHIAAPAKEVWAQIVDWPNHSDWMMGTRVMVVAGDGTSVGSRLIAFTGVIDIGFLDTVEITDWEPPRLYRARHLGRFVRGTAEFIVERRGEGSHVRWVEGLEPPFGALSAIGLRVAGLALQWGMRRSLGTLAGICVENRSQQHRAPGVPS